MTDVNSPVFTFDKINLKPYFECASLCNSVNWGSETPRGKQLEISINITKHKGKKYCDVRTMLIFLLHDKCKFKDNYIELFYNALRLAHPLLCEYEDSHFDSDDESALLSIFQNDNVENDANSQNDTYSQNSVSLLPKIFEGSIEQINPLPNQKVIVLSKLGVRVLIEKKMPNNTSSKKY